MTTRREISMTGALVRGRKGRADSVYSSATLPARSGQRTDGGRAADGDA
jgi:hypothetical protein